MARIKQAIVLGGTSLVLALSLAACGSSGDAGDSGATATEQEPAVEAAARSQEAELDPAQIEAGWLDAENTSDLWWPDGDTTAEESLFFTDAANDAGMDATFVDAEGREDGVWDLEVVDGHLKTKADAPDDKRQVDITFQDNFTCYDAVSNTFYLRGDRSQADYDALFAETAFVEDPADPDKFMVTFEEDGTTIQRQGTHDPLEGTWEVVSTNVVVCHYATDTSKWDTKYRFEIGADDTIAELDSGAPTKLQRFEQ